jgi:uncharacterized cupin superfamily protein
LSLVRAENRQKINIITSKLSIEYLTLRKIDTQLEVTHLTIEEGGRSGQKSMTHEGEEMKLCLEGSMAYTVDGVEYILKPGDCLQFKSSKPHSWRNIGKGQAKILSVCSPPPLLDILLQSHEMENEEI